MTLLVLRYHRARAGADGNSPEMLDAHFEHIAASYDNVVPGDPLPVVRPAVCLCFDGAFFDFYATVFPLLEKHELRAVLAVAPGVIHDQVSGAARHRLEIDSAEAWSRPNSGGFCTWRELDELARSGRVTIAAHGFSHRGLDAADADLTTEVHVPRTILAARLQIPVDSFVFPGGRYPRGAVREVKAGYRFAFGDGNASNTSWTQRLLYRISADNLRTPMECFETGRLFSYGGRRWVQRLLGV